MSKRPSKNERASKDKPSKKSKTGESSQPLVVSQNPPLLPRFIDEAAKIRFDNYRTPINRIKIVTCSYLDISDIESMHLEPIMAIFGKLGKFLHYGEIINETLVWEFYANLENVGPYLSTRVSKKDYQLTRAHIEDIFDYRTLNPINPFCPKSWPETFYDMNLKELARKYFKIEWTKDTDTKDFKPKNLDAIPRIVYEILWSVLAPSSGHSSEPTISQILFLYSILEGREVDYPAFIIGGMTQAILGGSKKDLPYGNFIMQILRHKNVTPPTSTKYISCICLSPSFFDHKRVQFSPATNSWTLKERKRPKRTTVLEPVRGSQEPVRGSQGESSTGLSSSAEMTTIVQNAIQAALAPLLEKLAATEARLVATQATLESERQANIVFRAQTRDELDTLRQGCLFGLDVTKRNEVTAYRKSLEDDRIEELGEGSRNLRHDLPATADNEPRQDSDDSDNSRTHDS